MKLDIHDLAAYDGHKTVVRLNPLMGFQPSSVFSLITRPRTTIQKGKTVQGEDGLRRRRSKEKTV